MNCPHCGKAISIKAAAEVLGKKGGAAKTDRKVTASRENGKKGGRPRKPF
jgi:hypothetical protein